MRAFPSSPTINAEQESALRQGDSITLPPLLSSTQPWTTTIIDTSTNSSSPVSPSGETVPNRLRQVELKQPSHSSNPSNYTGRETYLPSSNQGHSLGEKEGLAQSVNSPSLSRQNWLQNQQRLQSQNAQYNPYQQYQHHNQQHQNTSTTIRADVHYPQSSLYQSSSQSANLSDHRPPSDFIAPSSFSTSQGGGNLNLNEGASALGMSGNLSTQPQEQLNYEQQNMNASTNQTSNPLAHYPFQRPHDQSAEQSDMSSTMSGSNSDWNSLPNLSLMRGMQGDFLSSSSSLQSSAQNDQHKGPHQSRARLQKHLRSLQAEMVDLKERVRVAEHLYQDNSTEASSTRSNEAGLDTKAYEDMKLNDARLDRRLMMGGQNDSSPLSLNPSGTFSSSFPSFSSTWRQDPYTSQVQQQPSTMSSISSSAPSRRGTWRTEGPGNVLVFNNANSSELESRSPTINQRRGEEGAQAEGAVAEEGEADDDDAGDDANKRYECLVPGCLKTFTTSGHARRHSRTHLGHKLFVCPHEGCRSTFTRRDNCRQHQRARHHMTLPVQETTEPDTLENLIVDRHAQQQQQQQSHQSYASGSSTSAQQQQQQQQQQQFRRPQY